MMALARPQYSLVVNLGHVELNRIVTEIGAWVGVQCFRDTDRLVVEWRLRREVYNMGVAIVKVGCDVISNRVHLRRAGIFEQGWCGDRE